MTHCHYAALVWQHLHGHSDPRDGCGVRGGWYWRGCGTRDGPCFGSQVS
jgi:hypothetical protein